MGYVSKITDTNGTTHLVASTLYGTCSTAAGTAEKAVTCASFDTAMTNVPTGLTIMVKFTNSNTAATPTLNINSKGAKNIYAYGTTKPGTTTQTTWNDGAIVSFTYDGSAWLMNDYKVSDINHNTDTKNTAGSTNTSNEIFLIGATSQDANPQTYSNSGLIYDGIGHTLKIGTGNEVGSIQLQAGNTVLYNTIIPGLNTQPISHTLPSSSGTLLNDTDYNSREVTIYTSYNNTMNQDNGISAEITGYRDKLKYIDIYYSDNNFKKGLNSQSMDILSENYGFKRVPYNLISKDGGIGSTSRVTLDLFGDENTFYLRKHTYYIAETPQANNRYTLNITPTGNNKGLIIQFYGTPGSGSFSDMTVKAQYGRFIKIYQINLILKA